MLVSMVDFSIAFGSPPLAHRHDRRQKSEGETIYSKQPSAGGGGLMEPFDSRC